MRANPLATLALGLALATSAVAAPPRDGVLDRGFGEAGYVHVSGVGWPSGFALDRSGRAIVAGEYTVEKIALARVVESGAIDAGFGVAGRVTLSFPPGSTPGTPALATLFDGRVVVAVVLDRTASTRCLYVAALTEAGGIDPAYQPFATSGSCFDFGGAISGNRVALADMPDGALAVSVPMASGAILAVIGANGQLDTTFAGTGFVQHNGSIGVTAQSDSRLVVPRTVGASVEVRRYGRNGTPDAGFGTAGVATIGFAAAAPAPTATLRVDTLDRIVAFTDEPAVIPSSPCQVCVARLSSDGAIDNEFGDVATPGVLRLPNDIGIAQGAAMDGDRPIPIVAMNETPTFSEIAAAGAVRLTKEGSVDTGFGSLDQPGTIRVLGAYNTPAFGAADASGRVWLLGAATDATVGRYANETLHVDGFE